MSEEDEIEVILRSFNKDLDQAFIFATWRNGAYYGSGLHQGGAHRFFKKQTAKIKSILPQATVKIACLKGAPEVIIGYSVATDSHLNWIFVKDSFRLKGVGSLLFPKNIESVTDQLTKVGKILVEKKNLTIKGDETWMK